jgi:hypothetical protein
MPPTLRLLARFLTSLRLTVVLLVLSMLLVFFATLAQVDLGIWAVQARYFRSLFVTAQIPGTGIAIPWFPGGYLIGGLLLINLTAAHATRLKLSWAKSGLWLTHFGLILLLLGELFTGLWQQESLMAIDQGDTKSYSESRLQTELAVIDTTDPKFDEVVAIPTALLEDLGTIQYPRLPFRIHPTVFYPNSTLRPRTEVPNAPPSLATQGVGPQIAVLPEPITYKQDEQNIPTAVLELAGADGPLGTWLVSLDINEPQTLSVGGHIYELILRPKRHYHPFSLTLLKFSHDLYPGTDIPKNFSSRVRLRTPDGSVDREVLIYMNNPLRYGGLTFYQASFQNNDRTTILQVVRNPSWLLPYVSCVLMGVGLLIQFGIHLTRFLRKRTAAASAATAATC